MATQSVAVEAAPGPVPTIPTEPESFRSEAEIKALRILDEIEEEHNNLLLVNISGRRCAKRQRHIYDQAFGSDAGGDIINEFAETF